MQADEDTLREFLLILRSALLMIVRWIEQKYGLSIKRALD